MNTIHQRAFFVISFFYSSNYDMFLTLEVFYHFTTMTFFQLWNFYTVFGLWFFSPFFQSRQWRSRKASSTPTALTPMSRPRDRRSWPWSFSRSVTDRRTHPPQSSTVLWPWPRLPVLHNKPSPHGYRATGWKGSFRIPRCQTYRQRKVRWSAWISLKKEKNKCFAFISLFDTFPRIYMSISIKWLKDNPKLN